MRSVNDEVAKKVPALISVCWDNAGNSDIRSVAESH